MAKSLYAVLAAALLCAPVVAMAQSETAPGTESGVSAPASAGTSAPAAKTAGPSGPSKRQACREDARGIQRDQRRDSIEICLAQARLDCTKNAVAQKIPSGKTRLNFIRDCMR